LQHFDYAAATDHAPQPLTPNFWRRLPIGTTARSSRKIISVIRAETVPTP
jgi:hypothetical protein